MEEIARGYRTVEQAEQGKCKWSEVYKKLPFFTQYRHFLHIEVLAKSPQTFTKWIGWIESKLRQLVKHLEQSVKTRPWPDHLEFKDPTWPHATAVFMGLDIPKHRTVDLREQVTKFVEHINSWAERADNANLCDMRVRYVNRRDLPDYAPGAEHRASLRRPPPEPVTPTEALLPQKRPVVAAELLPNAVQTAGATAATVASSASETAPPAKRPRAESPPPSTSQGAASPSTVPAAPSVAVAAPVAAAAPVSAAAPVAVAAPVAAAAPIAVTAAAAVAAPVAAADVTAAAPAAAVPVVAAPPRKKGKIAVKLAC